MGRGIIHVSQALFEKQELPYNGAVNDDEPTKLPETLAEWHALLMLPEDYRLLEAKLLREFQDQAWELLVENEAIPEQEGKLVEISPIFRMDFNEDDGPRKIYLDRIEINRYAPDMQVIWQSPKEQ